MPELQAEAIIRVTVTGCRQRTTDRKQVNNLCCLNRRTYPRGGRRSGGTHSGEAAAETHAYPGGGRIR